MQIEAIKRECFCLKTAYRNKGSKLKYIGKSAFALYAKSMELEEAVEKAVDKCIYDGILEERKEGIRKD